MTLERQIIQEIKKELSINNMTQAELAEAIGKHPQSLNRNLKGKSSMNLDTLNKIYRVLGLRYTIHKTENQNVKLKHYDTRENRKNDSSNIMFNCLWFSCIYFLF